MTSPFEKVYARLLEVMPNLEMRPGNAVQASQLIGDWLAIGADADLDILPAINKAWAKLPTGEKLTSARYFDNAVRQAHATRVGSAEAKASEALCRAKAIKFKRDRAGMYVPTYELAYLEQYENQHGAIAL